MGVQTVLGYSTGGPPDLRVVDLYILCFVWAFVSLLCCIGQDQEQGCTITDQQKREAAEDWTGGKTEDQND